MDSLLAIAIPGIILEIVILATFCYAVDQHQKRQIAIRKEMHELEKMQGIERRGKE